MKPRSQYRRGKFKFKKSEPNKVFLQVRIQQGKELIQTNPFEINFDSLTCQRFYLDDNRKLYVICQIQNKEGNKILVVRSPMQVSNHLQIPIEVQLLRSSDQQLINKTSEESQLFQRTSTLLHRREDNVFSMIIKPESS